MTSKCPCEIGLGVFALLAIYDRVVYDVWISRAFSNDALLAADRGALAPIYILAFALDGFLLAWLLLAAPAAGTPWLRRAGGLLRAVLLHPALTLLGRHGLQVFAWQIAVVYAVAAWNGPSPPQESVGTLVLILGTLSIYLPPLVLERRLIWPRRAAWLPARHRRSPTELP